MKKILIHGGKLAFLLFFLNAQDISAQPGGTPGGDSGDPNAIPIDGGASVLAAAGVAYGVKKYRDYRKGSVDDAEEE